MKKIITLIFLVFTLVSFGQRLINKDGSIKDLKAVEFFDVTFDYSNVEIPHYESEAAFLETKMRQRQEKAAGSGEVFKNNWFDNREAYYHPSFVKSFNKWFNPKKNAINTESDFSKHSIHIEITFLYTGYNVVAANQNAKVGAIISIYKKSEPSKLLFRGEYKRIKGGTKYDEKTRISAAFSNLAKHTALYILRKAK